MRRLLTGLPSRPLPLFAGVFTLLFVWLFSRPLATGGYLAESDLYEYYLPIFLAPITTWSSFEFGGLPAFADPGDFSLYPLHFLARLIGSWTLLAISAYVVAATLTAVYVFRLTGSRFAGVFAGLSYGLSEAMLERLPHLGTLHAFAWLPLIVMAIDGLRTPHRRAWMAAGAVGVGCCFLAGHPQPAIYTYYLCGAYALAGGVVERARVTYYRDVFMLFLLGGLLAAVKVIPLAEASLHMARQLVSFGQFASRANSPLEMLALLLPGVAHDGREAPLYVGLATLALAAAGLRGAAGWRSRFWLTAGLIGLALGAGAFTPLARMAYELPLYDKFRVAARHLFMFAFAASVLAGLAIAALERREITVRRVRISAMTVLAAMLTSAAVRLARPDLVIFETGAAPLWAYVAAGIAAVAATVAFARAPGRSVAFALLCTATIVDLLLAVPYRTGWLGLHPIVLPEHAADPSVHATALAGRLAPERQRLLAPAGTHLDAVSPAAWSRVWQIPSAGGYGPMLLARHSAVMMMGTNGSVDPGVLFSDNAALDILAVKAAVFRTVDLGAPERFERDGLTWNRQRLDWSIGSSDCGQVYPRRSRVALPPGTEVAEIALVSHLRCFERVTPQLEVARLRLGTGSGWVHESPLRIGHELETTRFDDPDAADPVSLTRIRLPSPMPAAVVEVTMPAIDGGLMVDRLTVVDASGRSIPIGGPSMHLDDATRWSRVGEFRTSRISDRGADGAVAGEEGFVVYENRRALPRAWVVPRVIDLDEDDMLAAVHHSQLPDGTLFDPREAALVDPGGDTIGPFPTGAAVARVSDIGDGRITVDVDAPGGGFLVLSEAFYPGWRARIGERTVAVRRTNVSLQGVAVPPGKQVVVFELVSATHRAGIAVSLAALIVVLWLAWRRQSGLRASTA